MATKLSLFILLAVVVVVVVIIQLSHQQVYGDTFNQVLQKWKRSVPPKSLRDQFGKRSVSVADFATDQSASLKRLVNAPVTSRVERGFWDEDESKLSGHHIGKRSVPALADFNKDQTDVVKKMTDLISDATVNLRAKRQSGCRPKPSWANSPGC